MESDMANEIGTGYSEGDFENSNYYNGEVSAFNKPRQDAPGENKNRTAANDVNDMAAEVVATQVRLGAGAHGAKASVEERLSQSMDTDGNINSVRSTIGFTTLEEAIKNGGSSASAGEIHGQ